MKRLRSSVILMFPLAQWISFAICLRTRAIHPGWAVASFAIAALALCFSVHITFHEAVHQRFFRRGLERAVDSLITLSMGLPFNGYRWHHFNHHRFNNTLDDYSSTWQQTPAGPLPRSWWAYCLGWPVQLVRARQLMDQEEVASHLPKAVAERIAIEKYLLIAAFTAVAILSPFAAAVFALLVYVGWFFVSLENYAQHPPLVYGVDPVMSYYDAFYNLLFCKNGLHAEHHRTAAVPWAALRPEPGTRSLDKPYLLAALFVRSSTRDDSEVAS